MTDTVFLLNQSQVRETAASGVVMLDVIRNHRRLSGCKEVCREGDCGACLVLHGRLQGGVLVYQPVVSCLLPLAAVAGSHVVTIEGLNGAELTPIQQALVNHGAIQCGYCTPGLVLALTAFFLRSPDSNVESALDAVAGNLCRCTGYAGIKRAVIHLCRQFDLIQSPLSRRLRDCVAWGLLPSYFLDIAQRLAGLPSTTDTVAAASAEIVAGGTDLWVRHGRRLQQQPLALQATIADDRAVTLDKGACRIDAVTTMAQLRASPIMQGLLPSLPHDVLLLASEPIRQRATVGGNLANASPIGDCAVMLLALNADVVLIGANGERSLPLRDFFIAYKQTVLQPEEDIGSVNFAAPPGLLFSFEKVGKRQHLDIASVNSALSLRVSGDGTIETCHLAAGGVAPIPLYLQQTSNYLTGQPLNNATVLRAAKIAQQEIQPIDDIRGSAAYKRLLLRQLLYAHFLKLFPDLIAAKVVHAAG